MKLTSFKPSNVLRIEELDNVEAFRETTTSATQQRVLPQSSGFETRQAALRLNLLSLTVTEGPPMITDGIWMRSEMGIAIQMNDQPTSILNGQRLSGPGLAPLLKGTEYRWVEPEPWTLATIICSEELADRCWPKAGQLLEYYEVPNLLIAELRSALEDAVGVASTYDALFAIPDVVAELEDNILSALDAAFASSAKTTNASQHTYRHIILARQVDDILRSNSSTCLTCSDIACAVGQTVRTMHNAIVATNGVSLKKFIQRYKLWSVHHFLMEADEDVLIKTVALDHGFWHLGRFAQAYHAQFGESPSETLARAREQKRSSRHMAKRS